MATLQTSGAISVQNLITHFGGGSLLTDFYRGGARVPSTRTTTTTTNGAWEGPFYWWPAANADYAQYQKSNKYLRYYWGGTLMGTLITQFSGGGGVSWEFGQYEYVSGTVVEFEDDNYKNFSIKRRTVTTTSTTININTGVPTSGAILLTNFYGAHNS